MLEIEIARLRGLVEMIFIGDLDAGSVPQAQVRWAEVLEEGPAGILLNLRRLTFLDGSGARFLLRCCRDAAARASIIAMLSGGNQRVERPLAVLQWDQALPLFTTRAAALAALPGRWQPESVFKSAIDSGEPQVDSLGGIILWRTDGRRAVLGKRTPLLEALGEAVPVSYRDEPHPLIARILEDDRKKVLAASAALRRTGRGCSVEYRVLDRRGNEVWLCDLYLPAPASRRPAYHQVLTYDVSERKAREERVRLREQHFRTLVDLAQEAVWCMDARGRCEYVNRQMSQMLGLPREEIVGRSLLELVDGADRPTAEELLASLRLGRSPSYELRFRSHQGSPHWKVVATRPVVDASGRFTRTSVVATEVKERGAELESPVLPDGEPEDLRLTEAAEQRLLFLTRSSRMLASTLDLESAARNAAQMFLPLLADCCVIDGLDTEGVFSRWATATVRDFGDLPIPEGWPFPPDARGPGPLEAVLRTGEAVTSTSEWVRGTGSAPPGRPERGGAGASAPLAFLCLPLKAETQVFGVLTLARTVSERPYTAEEIALGKELALSVSQALANARQFTAQREICRTLQESLLPPRLPEIEGFELAAVYQPAGLGAEVGGDFYDLFEMRDGTWAAVIGDVAGKGARAAATTALIRHTLRALTLGTQRPQEVLRRANVAIKDQVPDECFCTVLFARLSRRGNRVRVRLASAGHVPPLVLRSTGHVTRLDLDGILLGGLPEITLVERGVELAPGDTLILYTDGVTEARSGGRLFGEGPLEGLVRKCAGAPAAEIVTRIREAAVEFQRGRPVDDLAVVALRLAG